MSGCLAAGLLDRRDPLLSEVALKVAFREDEDSDSPFLLRPLLDDDLELADGGVVPRDTLLL